MSAMTEQFSADVQAVEADLPVSFTFKGKVYTGQKSPTMQNLLMQDAGYIQNGDFELIVRLNQFANEQPEVNSNFIIERITYRVEKVTPSQDGVCATYGMVTA